MHTILFASNNPGKIAEVTAITQPLNIQLITPKQVPALTNIDPEETGETFAENALIKARTFGRLSGQVTIADDSGLCVDALDGYPGIKSKRVADTDEQRIQTLLDKLQQYPEPNQRTAHFISAMVLFDPSSEKWHQVEGRVDGYIALTPQGESGFGYDPIFMYPPLSKTFGQLSATEKNEISHRRLALDQMRKIIRKRYR